MGLPLPALRFLVRLHKTRPLQGPMLTLGRQRIYATYDDVLRVFRKEGVQPVKLPWPFVEGAKSSALDRSGYIDDASFFGLLGIKDVSALDVSAYEGARYLADLNFPVPDDLRGRFAFVLDGGTSEHIFNIGQCLANISLLLRPGGRVVHISPATNYVDHGYYNLSPRLLFDYYQANGFADSCGWLADVGWRVSLEYWKLYEYEFKPLEFDRFLSTPNPIQLLFHSQKTEYSTDNVVPVQRFACSAASPDCSGLRGFWHSHLKYALPPRARYFVKRSKDILSRILWKPPGVSYLGKL